MAIGVVLHAPATSSDDEHCGREAIVVAAEHFGFGVADNLENVRHGLGLVDDVHVEGGGSSLSGVETRHSP